MEASIDVQPSWNKLLDLPFDKLQKAVIVPKKTSDRASCGRLLLYNPAFDKIVSKNEV